MADRAPQRYRNAAVQLRVRLPLPATTLRAVLAAAGDDDVVDVVGRDLVVVRTGQQLSFVSQLPTREA